MKKIALLAAATALIAATPAHADGFLGVAYGNGELDLGSNDIESWRGEGALGWRTGQWGGQVGASLGQLELGATDADAWALDGHLYWDAGGWLVGGVVTARQIDFGAGGGGSRDEMTYGVEVLANTSANSTAFAALRAGETEFSGTEADTLSLDAGLNVYLSPNIRLGAVAAFGDADFDVGAESDFFSLALNGEVQPFTAPVSIGLGWSYTEVDAFSSETDVLHVSMRWNFGGGTLQERDQSLPFGFHTSLLGGFFGW